MEGEQAPRPEPPRREPARAAESQITPDYPEVRERPAAAPPPPREEHAEPAVPAGKRPVPNSVLQVVLNGKTLILPGKPEGVPYYVMDLLEHSGIDFEHLDRGVELQVNGEECAFSQELRPQDEVIIRYLET